METKILFLAHAEFVYSINRSIGKSLFEIVHGLSPRQLIDLLPLPTDYRPSDYTQVFVEHIHNLHTEIYLE